MSHSSQLPRDAVGTSDDAEADPPIGTSSSTHHPTVTADKGKAKASERDSKTYRHSPIQNLPFECLTHVFAHLPPRELGTCQLVCRLWNEVVGDEASWRTAFEMYYGISATSLGRRIEPSSWRAEYIARVALMRLWHRSRTPTVTSNPSLGALSSIFIHLNSTVSQSLHSSRPSTPSRVRDSTSIADSTLLSVLLPLGAAIHSLPFTGKLSKRPLLSTPIDQLGRPLQNLAVVATTAFAISTHDGNRIVWGMRDGTIRVSNSTPTGGVSAGGGRGTVGSTIEQGEVRQIADAHREGTSIHLVSFSNLGGTGGGRVLTGTKQRGELFVSIGRDGFVHAWTLNVPPVAGARERAPIAVKMWSSRWDVEVGAPPSTSTATAAAAEAIGPRVRATAVAFDSGWIGRHNGRVGALAIGRSDGKVVVWPVLDLPDVGTLDRTDRPIVLEAREPGPINALVLDSCGSSNGARSLLAKHEDSTRFSRYTFPPPAAPDTAVTRIVYGHPVPNQLSMITSLAVDFDEPPSVIVSSQPATPSESSASISLVPPRLMSLASSSTLPPLSRTNSSSTWALRSSNADAAFGSKMFGRRKYVVAGDFEGRVYLWDWSAEPENDGEIVAPSKIVQDVEVPEGGGTASKVTALEVTDAGVFVGGLDGSLRFYSSLGPPLTAQAPVRTFRDRSAPRHPARMLAQGLVPDEDEERWLVSHVRANRDCVVAAIGGRILAWRTEASIKKRSGAGARNGKVTARQERFKAHIELQHQVKESLSALSAESSARVERFEEEHRLTSQFGLPPSLDNLTEEEAIAFAMMLSAEEEEKKLAALALDTGKGRDFGDDDSEWEQAPEEWLRDDIVLDEDLDQRPSGSGLRGGSSNIPLDDYSEGAGGGGGSQSQSQSLSTSLNVPPSPYLRGSSVSNGSPSPSPRTFSAYSWKPTSAASSPLLSALSSPTSNSKLQISPRLGPTYGSSFSQYANDPVPDMDPALWPTAASTSTSPPLSSSASRKASFAAASSSSTPPFVSWAPGARCAAPAIPFANAAGGTGTPIRRGWSHVAAVAGHTSPTPSSAPSPTPSSRWAASSPGTSIAPSSSLLADQLRASQVAAEEDDEQRRRRREEEDLRFALELSLVEQASQLEI